MRTDNKTTARFVVVDVLGHRFNVEEVTTYEYGAVSGSNADIRKHTEWTLPDGRSLDSLPGGNQFVHKASATLFKRV